MITILFNKQKMLDELKKLAKDRLSISGMPQYEKERLQSFIEPLSVEDSIKLMHKIPGVCNFVIFGGEKELNELVNLTEPDFSHFDEEDKMELEKIKKGNCLFGINSRKQPIWNCFCTTDWMLNYNVIMIKL